MCGSIKSKQSTLGQRLLQMPPVTFVQLVSASKIAVGTAAPQLRTRISKIQRALNPVKSVSGGIYIAVCNCTTKYVCDGLSSLSEIPPYGSGRIVTTTRLVGSAGRGRYSRGT